MIDWVNDTLAEVEGVNLDVKLVVAVVLIVAEGERVGVDDGIDELVMLVVADVLIVAEGESVGVDDGFTNLEMEYNCLPFSLSR